MKKGDSFNFARHTALRFRINIFDNIADSQTMQAFGIRANINFALPAQNFIIRKRINLGIPIALTDALKMRMQPDLL